MGGVGGSKALHLNVVETYFEEGIFLCVHRWPRSFIQGQKQDGGSGWEIKVLGCSYFGVFATIWVKLRDGS